MKKRLITAGIVIAVLVLVFVLVLGAFASHPIIICNIEIPEDYLAAIESQSKGLYSDTLPLVPICAVVHSYSENKVLYTIYYFPFGTVGMSFVGNGGYNIEKPLMGL